MTKPLNPVMNPEDFIEALGGPDEHAQYEEIRNSILPALSTVIVVGVSQAERPQVWTLHILEDLCAALITAMNSEDYVEDVQHSLETFVANLTSKIETLSEVDLSGDVN